MQAWWSLKKNSKFFEDYILKIYDRREASGIDDLVTGIRAVVVQVARGEAIKYLMELYLMTPYRFQKGYETKTHRVYQLHNKEGFPALAVLEPLKEDYHDKFSSLNSIYPRAHEKTNVRYIGEIFHCKDAKELSKIFKDQEIRLQKSENIANQFLANKNFSVSDISYFTGNIITYSENLLSDFDELNLGEPFELEKADALQLQKADEVHKEFGLDELVQGLDHLATRIFCGEREDAILEFLCMTNYYLWGAFNITEMNSSTIIKCKLLYF